MIILKLLFFWFATATAYLMIVKIGILVDFREFHPFIPKDGTAAALRWNEFPIALHSAIICIFSIMTPLALIGLQALIHESSNIDNREPSHIYLHQMRHTFLLSCVFNILIWSILPMIIGTHIQNSFRSDFHLTYSDLLYPIYFSAVVCNLLIWRMFFKKRYLALENRGK
jgi:hypothetical protein